MGSWYIVQTMPQMERKAASEVRRLGASHGGFRAYVPKWSQIVTRNNRTSIKFRPLYAGYIFVRFPDGYYNDLADCRGVRRILKRGDGTPAIIPAKLIAALLRHQRELKEETDETRIYRLGRRRGAPSSFDAVMSLALFSETSRGLIVSGPWTDHEVDIVGVAKDGLIEVALTLLGHVTHKFFKPLVEVVPVALDRAQIAA